MADNLGNFISSVNNIPAVQATNDTGTAIIVASSGEFPAVIINGGDYTALYVDGRSSGSAAQFKGQVSITGMAVVTGTAWLQSNVTVGGNITASGDATVRNITASGDATVRNITASGDVILTGADCAEEFDVAEAGEVEPGTVMVLDQEGGLHQSQKAYDKRVAGVISGAGDYRPGIILDRQQSDKRLPVALVGKVYCKVDAHYAPIEVGDLLTTSPTPGYAMKADDPFKAFGSVIGKAMRPLKTGQGMIPILIALQ